MRFASAAALFDHYFIKLGFLEAAKKIVPSAAFVHAGATAQPATLIMFGTLGGSYI